MKKLWRLLEYLDKQLIQILLVFFIFLIPLWPKFRVFGINYTYVSVRLEDFYIGLLVIVFAIQLVRKKVTLNRVLLIPSIIFWIIAFASVVSGIYYTKSLPYHQLAYLNALRRVEYMSVFFIASSSIRSIKDLKILLYSLMISLLLVNIYGIGQRFYGWPAVQTMNDEFAKGHLITLTPEARLSSTFGGHYDLAAYLTFLIPIIWGLLLTFKRVQKFVFALALFTVYILTLTVSRIAFVAYAATTPLYLLTRKKFLLLIFVIIYTVALTFNSPELIARFLRTIQKTTFLINIETGKVYIPQTITTKELPAGELYVKLPKSTSEAKMTTAAAALKKEIIFKTELERTDLSLASKEAEIRRLILNIKPITGFVYDISFATRLQIEWPRAIASFLKNPILGTGPSSITEATDNDYLRWLGEFGILGFLSFMFILLYLAIFIIVKVRKYPQDLRPILYAPFFSLLAMMIISLYIDVFEASKAAYVFWFTMGAYVGFLSLKQIDQV